MDCLSIPFIETGCFGFMNVDFLGTHFEKVFVCLHPWWNADDIRIFYGLVLWIQKNQLLEVSVT